MNYKNGRSAQLNDRVVAVHPSGKFIGTVSAFEGEHLRVHPLFCSSAFYVQPSDALLLSDALIPDAQLVQVAPAPVAQTAPSPVASEAKPSAASEVVAAPPSASVPAVAPETPEPAAQA
jgi:hypothetical protein